MTMQLLKRLSRALSPDIPDSVLAGSPQSAAQYLGAHDAGEHIARLRGVLIHYATIERRDDAGLGKVDVLAYVQTTAFGKPVTHSVVMKALLPGLPMRCAVFRFKRGACLCGYIDDVAAPAAETVWLHVAAGEPTNKIARVRERLFTLPFADDDDIQRWRAVIKAEILTERGRLAERAEREHAKRERRISDPDAWLPYNYVRNYPASIDLFAESVLVNV